MKRKTEKEFKEEVSKLRVVNKEPYRTALEKIRFLCLTCENEWTATPNYVLQRKGCPLCRKRRILKKKRFNNEVLSEKDGVLEVDVSTNKHPKTVMLIEKQDWDKLKNFGRVHAVKHGRSVYARLKIDGKMDFVHRVILRHPKMCDHKNGDGLDNRRTNLRPVTHSQNNMNKAIFQKNKSGIPGVRLKRGKWEASIGVDGKCKYLGTFSTKEKAAKARKDAELLSYGEYSRNYMSQGRK